MSTNGYDARIQDYLNKLNPSTHSVATATIDSFTAFYNEYGNGTIIDFFRRVYEDNQLPPLDQKKVDTNTIAKYIEFLKSGKYKNRVYQAKTIRTYVGQMQSIGAYLRIPFSSRFTGLPPALAVNKKHSWELDEVAKFIESFDDPMYQAIGTAFFQSGSDVSTLRDVTYGDIQEEYEAGIFPLCLDMARHKTHIVHLTFLGEWATKHLKVWIETIGNVKSETKLFSVSRQSIDAYFRKQAIEFAGVDDFESRNPYSPHTLRAAFNTHARDHKADPIYTSFFMGHQVPEQEKVYVSKTRQGWRKTYVQQYEPWVTPVQYRRKELQEIALAWAKSHGYVG
jgi:integrase